MQVLRGLGRASWLIVLLAGAFPARADPPASRFALASVDATVYDYTASSRPTGYGWLEIELASRAKEPRTARLEVGVRSPLGVSYRATRTVELTPGAEARVHLPFASVAETNWGAEVRMDVGSESHTELLSTGPDGASALVILAGKPETDWNRRLARAYGSAAHHQIRTLRVERLPRRWALLTGYHTVLVDARTGDIPAAAQRTLHRYLAAGGRLVIAGASRLPPGPLKSFADERLGAEANAGTAALQGTHAFGRWLVTASHAPDARRFARLFAPDRRVGRHVAAGSHPPFATGIEIPGVGEVPVRAFSLLILLFAVAVGPVNYVYLRRRRRLALLVLTVPVLGAVSTLTILFYGYFSEGFGVRGAAVSITHLDQIEHRAVTATTQTLFAGLQPSFLEPREDTLVTAGLDLDQRSDFASFRRRSPRGGDGLPFRIDEDEGGRIDGALIRPRTPFEVFSLAQSERRDRIRFRRDDRSWRILADPSFRPTRLLVRDPTGQWHTSDDGETLARVGFTEAHRWLLDWNRYDWGQTAGLGGFLETSGQHAPHGHYVAIVESLPGLDDFGLDTTFERTVHIVYGRLGPEDWVE